MDRQDQERSVPAPAEYEPPRIEATFTDDTLKREVKYAGEQSFTVC